jgi:hypothetical protein
MKDISATHSKLAHARNTVYPKKRPSPHRDGASKHSSSQPPRKPAQPPRVSSEVQRQRALDMLIRREMVLTEEVEYAEDIERYMHEVERATMSSAHSMDQQPEIRWHMRPCLVDFLIEIHLSFRLRPETLYLTLNIVDRYVSKRVVYVKHYQLVGCAALWIAAKFEDAKERVPTVQELHQICHGAYEESAFIQMEYHVLSTIQWKLGHPTAEAWLRLACCGDTVEELTTQHVASFLMEITLFYREYIDYPPSVIAAASLLLARFVEGLPIQSSRHDDAVLEVVQLLDTHLAEHLDQVSDTLVKKYSRSYYSRASTVIVHFYLSGNRFTKSQPTIPSLPSLPAPPVTPTSSRPPALTHSGSSDADDLLPITPSSSYQASEPCIMPQSAAAAAPEAWRRDKENVPITAGAKSKSVGDEVSLLFASPSVRTPADACGAPSSGHTGRTALQDLNGCAPSPPLNALRQVVS